MNKLYLSLAATNIKSSRQLYIPYLITGIIISAMFYSMLGMRYNQGLSEVPGSGDLKMILGLGNWVIGIFVFIFLFYTNSFIIRRRKKELSIYNILGMEKRHVARVLGIETVFAAAVSIGGGLITGIVFNKLLMMFLYKLVGFTSSIQFEVSGRAVVGTVILFAVIYGVILIYDIMQVKLSKPVELLRGGSAGEKEPKTKLVMALAGAVCLAAAYYMAITTTNSVMAIQLFFVAVILVIIGTYMLFTAGSIAMLKALRRNKNYYYQTKHFISVSGMIYRMKQNAVGLANICILSTMVLVMLSTTVSMFVGVQDEVNHRYPTEISVEALSDGSADGSMLLDTMKSSVKNTGRTITSESSYTSLSVSTVYDKGQLILDEDAANGYSMASITAVVFMTPQEFEKMSGEHVGDPGVDGVIVSGAEAFPDRQIGILDKTYNVVETKNYLRPEDEYMVNIVNNFYYIVLPNQAELERIYQGQKEAFGKNASMYKYFASIDIDGSVEQRAACDNAVSAELKGLRADGAFPEFDDVTGNFRELEKGRFYLMYGGLLFLGLFLGVMFLMVTVLIIFYKQISEGYDDRARFEIMEKVGMSSQEVKESIRSQVRTVFILPIAAAAVHVTFAFPMINAMLKMLNLTNTALFAGCLAGTTVIFAIVYTIVFRLTSQSYYRIVGKQ